MKSGDFDRAATPASAAAGGSVSTVTDRIASELKRQIEQGNYRTGQRLPSSRQLAAEFGVSLNTVQAALGRLQAMGLTTSAPRRRSVVREGGKRRARPRAATRGMVLMFGEPDADSVKFDSSWGSQILFAAECSLTQQGLPVAKMHVPAVEGKIQQRDLNRAVELMKSASAVIWLASAGLQPLILDAIDRGIPCVTLNAPPEVMDHNVIKADNVAGGRTVGQVFARLGYHRCLLLTRGIRYRRFAPELAQGFLDSFMKAGIPLRGVEYQDLAADKIELAEEAVRNYLKNNQPPYGIFGVSDVIAHGAMRACQAHGLRVPEDVGVVSATGFEAICESTRPTLCSWQQPTKEMGEAAAKMLLHLLENPGDRLPPLQLGSTLVLRGSLPRHDELVDLPNIRIPS